MFVSRSVGVDHKDLIQDVAYDFHGKRMATCSCDQFVKIWDLIDGEWKCTSSWKCHTGSVWRVAWAHPEFGQVIATCSFDRTAVIWEELPAECGQPCRWVKRGNLVDSRTSVVDIKFGPKHLGLILATCSVDGTVRIYEAADIMNLNVWNLAYEIQCQVPTCCISWSTSRCFQPTIAVGSDDSSHTGGRVQIYEYNDAIRKYVKVEAISTILDPVRDVAFSPNLGRSYHMLAVASKDVHLLTLKPLSRGDHSMLDSSAAGSTKFEIRCIGQFSDHQSQVWRLSWNVTGTILASSGDDGYVRLWKGNYMDHWKCISEIKGESSDTRAQATPSAANSSSQAVDRSNGRFVFTSNTSSQPTQVRH